MKPFARIAVAAILAGACSGACSPRLPRATQLEPQIAPRSESQPLRSAFVVYLDRTLTLLVPLDRGGETGHLDGLWVPKPGSAVRYGPVPRADPSDMAGYPLRVCADPSPPPAQAEAQCDPTAALLVTLHADGKLPPEPRFALPDGRRCGCFFFRELSDDPDPDEEDEEDVAVAEPGDDDACDDVDGEMAMKPVSVVGGAVHLGGEWYNQGCSGVAYWAVDGEVVMVSPSYEPRAVAGSMLQACDALGQPDFNREDTVSEVAACRGDLQFAWLHRGQYAKLAVNVDNTGARSCCAVARTVSPETCPSAVDPCGVPRTSDGIGKDEPYWVASDGSAAMVRRGHELVVIDRQRSERFAVEVGEATRVIGVHFVLDAAAYLETIQNHAALAWRAGPMLYAADDEQLDSVADHGNLAWAQFKAGNLAQARAAAFAGLRYEYESAQELDPHPHTRGAILYTLGRVSEAEGRAGDAKAYYTRSLAVRPGNAQTQARLDAL